MKLQQDTYVQEAEKVMRKLLKNRRAVTTSKIRKVLSMVSDIYNDAKHYTSTKLDQDFLGRIQYLKLHIVYEAGREETVKDFVEEGHLLSCIDDIGTSREKLILFCHYMEALVAYRKYLSEEFDKADA